MAPEQSDPRARITPATDVWAVGLLAFWALSGRSYWRGAGDEVSVQAVMREVLFEPLDPASNRSIELGGPGLPFGFDAWFAKAVARGEGERFPDASVAFAALEAVLTGRPMPAAATPVGATLPGGPPLAMSAPAGATVLGAPPESAAFQVAPTGAPTPVGPGATQMGGQPGPALTHTPHVPAPPALSRPSSSKWGLFLGLGLAALAALGAGGYVLFGSGASKKTAVRESRDDDERERKPRHSAERAELPSSAPWVQEAAIAVSSLDPQLGPKGAPVTLVVFADYQCAFCKKLDPTLKELRARYGDDLRVVWKDLPLEMLPTHPNARKIAVIMQSVFSAKGNAAFWRVHDKLLPSSL